MSIPLKAFILGFKNEKNKQTNRRIQRTGTDRKPTEKRVQNSKQQKLKWRLFEEQTLFIYIAKEVKRVYDSNKHKKWHEKYTRHTIINIVWKQRNHGVTSHHKRSQFKNKPKMSKRERGLCNEILTYRFLFIRALRKCWKAEIYGGWVEIILVRYNHYPNSYHLNSKGTSMYV